MATSRQTKSFSATACAALPAACRWLAEDAARALEPFVDTTYESSSQEAVVSGQRVEIPDRIHVSGVDLAGAFSKVSSSQAIQSLCTRSTDGYLRQAALRRLLGFHEHWAIPFVVLLAGEYVAQIGDDLVAASPSLDQGAYASFVRENRPLMRLLRARATSYWDCYYRHSYADRSSYPGLAFLDQLERWAE